MSDFARAWMGASLTFALRWLRGGDQSPNPVRLWWLNPLAWVLLGAIRCYQTLAPDHLKPKCHYTPSCSNYMALAIRKYGVWQGVQAGVRRIDRCAPFGDRGEDWP
jgi:putative membrane protein insertion efficiency factor